MDIACRQVEAERFGAVLADLEEADRDLADELKPPAKLGHGGDQPAVGWLENLRLNRAGTKLLADIKRVPGEGRGADRRGRLPHPLGRAVEGHTSQKTGRVRARPRRLAGNVDLTTTARLATLASGPELLTVSTMKAAEEPAARRLSRRPSSWLPT